MHETVLMLGAIGAVILVAALTSGVLERTRLPQVMLFLLLGTAVGPFGLGLFDFDVHSTTVQVVATLGLVLVLFTDAVGVVFAELRRHLLLASIILGPGTALVALVTALAAHYLLGLNGPQSAILGAALASTDPVLLRGILRNPATPDAAKQALRIESGMNDAVLVPVVLVAAAMLMPDAHGSPWGTVLARVVAVGAVAGVAIGFLSVRALELVRRTIGMRRDYESMYVLGVALTAFAAAEALHGSGFIAAFAAGITIAALDIDMCECFYDYGEASAEMALLFTFVILGSSAIWSALGVIDARTLIFAAVALFARVVILAATLAPVKLDRSSRFITIWFGPRGLSSLLLVLLPLFAGVPGSEQLFAITSLVVLLSVVIHGGSQLLLPSAPAAPLVQLRPQPRHPAVDTGSHAGLVADSERITIPEVDALVAAGAEVTILDVRSDGAWRGDREMIAGSHRVEPGRERETIPLLGLPHGSWLVFYCT